MTNLGFTTLICDQRLLISRLARTCCASNIGEVLKIPLCAEASFRLKMVDKCKNWSNTDIRIIEVQRHANSAMVLRC